MFSEYASRFLAQSHSRVGFNDPEELPRRNPLQRHRQQDQTSSRHQSTRSYLQRPSTGGNPYTTGGSISHFPFASRTTAPNAPLFYSTTANQLAEEDDEEEHEREVADFYALQRSRRQFGGRLDESSETEEDRSRDSSKGGSSDGKNREQRKRGRSGGIKSSWQGGRPRGGGGGERLPRKGESVSPKRSTGSQGTTKSRGNLVDVGLESAILSNMDEDEPPDDLAIEIPADDDPPSIQQFRNPNTARLKGLSPVIHEETDPEGIDDGPTRRNSNETEIPPTVAEPADDPVRHDAFWGTLYLLSLASLFASFLLVYLHTSTPKNPLGDTVYTTLHASYHLLAVDTVVAVFVSLLWLAILRSYVRPLVYVILVAVPVILFSFFLYPLIASFQGKYKGSSIQDQAMRWFSFIPAMLAVFWSFGVYKGRHSFAKAISILEFACRILASNSGLLLVGFATLTAIITWTWIWTAMFTRVFLGGHLTSAAKLPFIIDASTWWLGTFFILIYLWTLSLLSGIQRATTAATVSQWYFHRLTLPSPPPNAIILAALTHSTTTLFGTISLSTLLTLAIRLPFLLLPRRLTALTALCSYSVLPSTIATLTNPLTLTYAAIHSQPLSTSSRALARLSFQSSPAHRLGASPFRARNSLSQTPLHSYTLALLLLRATRFITALALGFGGWVSTARSLTLEAATSGATVKGSLYAYIVGMIAAAIGWGVLGAIDGVVTGVVDAVVVCWGSEVARGEVRYCREAEGLFADSEERGVGGWDGEEDERVLMGR